MKIFTIIILCLALTSCATANLSEKPKTYHYLCYEFIDFIYEPHLKIQQKQTEHFICFRNGQLMPEKSNG